ncbi:hypothetical protein [Brevibacterium ravenspurgense]|uniref:hypothetical protein n=1 Tax=Brevibacterium TaxID=1696 RepID=UPI0003184784
MNTSANTSGNTGNTKAYSAMHSGPGRALTAVYGIFALSASARAGYQLVSHFDHAPLAYGLSAFSAVVYIVATVCLAIANRTAHRIAVVSVLIELIGVIAVGIFSLVRPELFPEATVWSGFGIGYGFVPLVLPVLGILWLIRVDRIAQQYGA